MEFGILYVDGYKQVSALQPDFRHFTGRIYLSNPNHQQ